MLLLERNQRKKGKHSGLKGKHWGAKRRTELPQLGEVTSESERVSNDPFDDIPSSSEDETVDD